MKKTVFVVAWLVWSSTLAQSSWMAREWPSLVERLQKAVHTPRTEEVRAVRDALLAADRTGLAPREESLLRYTIAYTQRALAFSRDTSEAQRAQLLDDAREHLEQAVALDERNAEAHALLGSTYGVLIGSHPGRAPELAEKSRRAFSRAERLAEHNPRLRLLQGIGAFHRPPEYGGGPDKAEPYLRKALALYRQEPASKPWPNWGRFDAHLWLGRSLQRLQRKAEALEQYRAALTLAPESEYVRDVLIPGASR